MKLDFDELGAGKDIVMLHGVFGSSSNWRTIARGLDGRHALLPDLRNHGESPHDDDMSYPAMTADVVEFINQESSPPVDVLGHSMGGKVAMHLALTQPDLVDRLIAVDIAPVDYGHGDSFRQLVAAMQNIDLETVNSRRDADTQLAERVDHPGVRGFLLQNLRRAGEQYAWRLNLGAIGASLGAIGGFPDMHVNPFDKPALFLHGGDSPYLKPEHHRRVLTLFPQARLVSVPGTGHWLHAEKPDVVGAHIADFLNEAS